MPLTPCSAVRPTRVTRRSGAKQARAPLAGLVLALLLSACAAPTPQATATPAPTATPGPAAAAPVLEALQEAWGELRAAGWGQVAVADLPASGLAVLDVDEASEYGARHLPGAIQVPLRQLMRGLDRLPSPKTPILVTSLSAHRAASWRAG